MTKLALGQIDLSELGGCRAPRSSTSSPTPTDWPASSPAGPGVHRLAIHPDVGDTYRELLDLLDPDVPA